MRAKNDLRSSNWPTLVITVTEEHIRRGRQRWVTRCPIALALNDRHPSDKGWTVSNDHAICWRSPLPTWHLLPKEAIDFIQAFDKGEAVGAFAFRLEAAL